MSSYVSRLFLGRVFHHNQRGNSLILPVSRPLPTHDGEPQQQVVGVAAAVAGVFVRHLGVVISLVLLLLLGLAGVGLVGCRLVRHPACGHSGGGV